MQSIIEPINVQGEFSNLEGATIWVAEYLNCIYEGAWSLLSINLTCSGAYRAMKEHRLKALNEAKDSAILNRSVERRLCRENGWKFEPTLFEYNSYESWRIRRVKVNR